DLAQAQHKDDVGQRRAQQSGGSSPQPTAPPTTGAPPASSWGGEGPSSSDSGAGTGGSGESGDGGTRDTATSSDAALVVSRGDAGAEKEQDDDATRAYLRARSGSDQLLAVIKADGSVLANGRPARSLAAGSLPGSGG